MHLAAAVGDLPLVIVEIEIEMRQRVQLDRARLVAKSVEFGQSRLGFGPLLDEATLDVEECALQLGIGQSFRRIGFEVGGERGHG